MARRWAQAEFPPVSTVTDDTLNFPVLDACAVGTVLLFLPVFSIVGLTSSSKAFSLSLLITKPLEWALSFLLPQQKTLTFQSDTNL